MINNPESLCYRVFKARFFPECSILEAKDSRVGFNAWKSILSARDVIRKGMVWRIGNGESVCIKQDKWLPSQLSRSVVSPIPQMPPDAKASELIDHDNVAWKTDVLIVQVLQIQQLRDNSGREFGSSGLQTRSSISFGRLVIMLYPPWRISTTATLSQQKFVEAARIEQRTHCKEIECVWHSMEWFHQDVSVQPVSFSDLFSRFMHSQDEFRLELFSITAWLLWNRRNARHFGRPVHPLSNICSMAGTFLQEFLAVQSKPLAPPSPIIMQQWRPPEHNSYKVNFDAATFSSTNSACTGVIVRDCAEEVIGALSMPIPMPQSIVAVEALACRRAVKFSAGIGLHRVVIEGDSAMIIKALTMNNGDQTSFGNIIEDIRALVSGFQLLEFNHVPRACNSIADALAKKASSVTGL
ncbi:uncharacterized protein LOC142632545 [Castanea sativa]|uniref:uncharacterized protein LOC142632545 n=1 Tax=Castanea sativa TaxID=21020 RepID=UPI003F6502D0